MSGKKIGKLLTTAGICEEYRRVYREARNERIDLSRARTLCWALKELSFMVKTADFEMRIEKLEELENRRASAHRC